MVPVTPNFCCSARADSVRFAFLRDLRRATERSRYAKLWL